MRLTWLGHPTDGTHPAPPNPEWPRNDHDEPNAKIAAVKIASTWYAEAAEKPARRGKGDA